MSSPTTIGPGLREPDPLPVELVESRWTLNHVERRALRWKLLVAVPIVLLLLVAVVAPGAFGAAVEACGGG